MQHVCFAPRQSRRAKYWKNAINSQCLHIDYLSLMSDEFSLDTDSQYLVRIESPGEDDDTTRLLIELGGGAFTQTQYGQFSSFDDWYCGWEIVLQKIETLSKKYHFHFINAPQSIALAFDKKATHQYLNENVECPPLLGSCHSFEELNAMLGDYAQVFVKPRYGSSASGVMAIKKNKHQYIAYTSLYLKDSQLFNSLKLKKYNRIEHLKAIFEHSQSEFIVEKWVPKMKYEGKNVDFRVVVIGGKIEFIIPRMSSHMITNIHLGNEKSQVDLFSKEIKEKIEDFSLKVADHFPHLGYAGLDILLDRNHKPYLLEINAFGDLILNVYNNQGRTTYEQEAVVFTSY